MRAIAIAIAVAAALCAAAPAQAEPSRSWVAAGLTRAYASSHLLVHYGAGISAPAAAGLALAGERALATYARWGYPAPVDDGDGRIDIYMQALPPGSSPTAAGRILEDS